MFIQSLDIGIEIRRTYRKRGRKPENVYLDSWSTRLPQLCFLNGAIPGLLFFIFVPVLIQLIVKKLPLTGSEQEITDV